MQTLLTKKISFIITYYNLPAEMLHTCIESILTLTLRAGEREIIIVDDGSDECPINELAPYSDDIIYIRQRNIGLSAARNIGIRVSTGEYIQFIDADDYLIQAPYEHCLDIVRYHDPDIVLFNSADRMPTEIPYTFEGPMEGNSYMRRNNIKAAAWSYIIRRKTLANLRFREGIFHEDEEFTPQLLLRAERLFTTDAKAYFYRRRANSITHNQDIRHVVKRLSDTESVILNLRNLAFTGPEADREALQRRVAQLTMDYLYNIIIQTGSFHHLEQCVERLYRKGLFPLPDRNYTRKYNWFRRLSASKLGRRMLCKLIQVRDKFVFCE